MVTVLEGITAKVSPHTTVSYNQGCGIINDTIFRGTWLIGDSEAVVAVMGLNSLLEGEAGDAWMSEYGGDRADIGLPANQAEYIKRLARGGKPLVVVVMAGGAVSLDEIEPYADAILYAWYPGEQGGNAVADVLFGDVNPSGRLPLTIYRSVADLPPFDDYSMSRRTYRYFTGEPEYPFGYGLSYTTFEYSGLRLVRDTGESPGTLELELSVSNTGPADGEEVVQLYFRKAGETQEGPLQKSMIAFRKITIKSGESRELAFSIPVSRLMIYDTSLRDYDLRKGKYIITAGRHSADRAVETTIEIR
jgi:beta-glucosidase